MFLHFVVKVKELEKFEEVYVYLKNQEIFSALELKLYLEFLVRLNSLAGARNT